MVLKVQRTANDVQVYTVSGAGSKSIPDWLARKNRRSLKYDEEYRSRIEVLQDFEFPEASNKIRLSPDGEYGMATGTYKPHIRVYEFTQLSLKFERHTNAENVTFEIVSDDWTKSVHLQADRSIDLHTAGGIHYSTRIPTFGRDIKYHYPTADLLVAAAGRELYRLNLDQGRFRTPLIVETASKGVNTVDICPAHQLFGFGTQNGTVEFWDPRGPSRIGLLDPTTFKQSNAISALKFADDGLNFAVGSSTGITTLFDLRSPVPIRSNDQGYDLPIKSLHYLQSPASDPAKRILSADAKTIKIWDSQGGSIYTSIDNPNDINDVQVVPGSGLILIANEGIPMHMYYVPALGPAPRWCSFLDNLTEELEEKEQSVYIDYKFVPEKEFEELREYLDNPNEVRRGLHGVFIKIAQYQKAKLIANPFEYEAHRQKQIASKIEKEQESRIRSSKKKTKVNNTLAARLQKSEERARAKGQEIGTSIVEDSRFKQAFDDEDFRIDETSHEYALLNPTRSKARGLTAAEESEEERVNIDSSSDDLSADDDEKEDEEDKSKSEASKRKADDDQIRTIKPSKPKAPKMHAIRPSATATPSTTTTNGSHDPRLKAQAQSFGAQLSYKTIQDARNRQIKENIKSDVAGKGSKEMTFIPEKKKKEVHHEGKLKQKYTERRSASGNVMRNMRS